MWERRIGHIGRVDFWSCSSLDKLARLTVIWICEYGDGEAICSSQLCSASAPHFQLRLIPFRVLMMIMTMTMTELMTIFPWSNSISDHFMVAYHIKCQDTTISEPADEVRDCRLVWRSHKRAGWEAQLRLWLGGADINLRHLNSLDTNLAPKHENQKFVNNNKIL